MKVFISSVRRGLEAERDALPGLIRALGHEPVRFEDFTAQPTASRDACLEGIERSDAYLLLVGGVYGDTVFDTGLSPTEEEWNVARRRGIPILVFRKRGVEMEERQERFVAGVEEYTGGRFRSTFDSPVNLQPQVVQVLTALGNFPQAFSHVALIATADSLQTAGRASTVRRGDAAGSGRPSPVSPLCSAFDP